MTAKFTRGLLAHQVDGGSGVTTAGEQTGSALEHLYPVINRHIGLCVDRGIGRVTRHWNAVVLEVLNGKAARVVLGALAVVRHDAHARRVIDHVVNRVELKVIHHLARHHADRLRCLARRKHQARGRGNSARRIGATALGDFAQLVGSNRHLRQGAWLARSRGRLHGEHAPLNPALQTRALEQRMQRLLNILRALHSRRLPPLRSRCRRSQLQVGLAGKLLQRAGQWLRGNIKTRGLCHGCLHLQGQTQADTRMRQQGATGFKGGGEHERNVLVRSEKC